MSKWQPWNNQTLDTREAASRASNKAANAAANAAQPATGEMRDVRKAATGTGDWPAVKPLVPHNDIEKLQP